MKHLIRTDDFTKSEIENLLEDAKLVIRLTSNYDIQFILGER
jgi:aspartate carbamoyltransferase catalytic subunit